VAADFPAAVDRRAAAAHRGAGDVEITPQDHDTIADAIHAAEQRTSGQIVCVLAHASDGYAHVPLIWASFLALLVPWPLIYLTGWSVQRIFLCQLVVFIVAVAVFWWWPIRLALVPRTVKRIRAHRAAIEQFFIRRVGQTANRCGVLIFVSLAEHYVRIVADDGIAAKVGTAEWQSTVDALIGHLRDGRITEGFVAAIERCGAVLAEHAPPDGSSNALPDRLYIM
jgi:putative membrane protein